jgi:hypothetical protein
MNCSVAEESIEPLLDRHRFSPYRRYGVVGLERGRGAPETDRQRLREGPAVIVDGPGSGVLAVAGMWEHAFESDVLGVRVFRSTALYAADGDRVATTAELCRRMLAHAAGDEPAVIVLRVDADDLEALAGAQQAGFRVVEAGATWFTRADPDIDVEDLPNLITMDAAACASVRREAIATVRDAAGRRFRGTHHHADPRMDRERVDELYRRWVDNTFVEGWGDMVVAYWEGDEITAFVSHTREQRRIGETTISCMTHSFGLTSERVPKGVGIAGARQSIRDLGDDLIEMSTQLRNPLMRPYARIFPAFTPFYTLHGWAR